MQHGNESKHRRLCGTDLGDQGLVTRRPAAPVVLTFRTRPIQNRAQIRGDVVYAPGGKPAHDWDIPNPIS